MHTCAYLTAYGTPCTNIEPIQSECMKSTNKMSLVKKQLQSNWQKQPNRFSVFRHIDCRSASHCSIGTKMKIESAIGMKFWHLPFDVLE